MSNYPTGAANDSRAPFNQTEVKPTKVDVIVYEAATQFNGDVQNFVVHVVNAEPGTVNGCGCTLAMALNDFEVSYELRHDEPCANVVLNILNQNIAMPNHIKNKLELIGSIEDIDQLIKRFSTYVPASLRLTHEEKLVICKPKDNSFDYRWLDLKTGELHGRKEIIGIGLGDTHELEIQDSVLVFPDFEKVIPPPNDPAYKDQPSQKEAEKSPNWWYRWNIDHWGTKWSAYECQRPALNVFTFETAWSSVPIIIEAISKAFPKVTMKYSWADEDTGYSCGRAIYLNGLLEEEKPEGGSKEAYELAFELRPGRAENYELIDGKYQYVEKD